MKRLILLLVLVLGISVPSFSYAQAQDANPAGSVTTNQVMSPEDIAKMRAQLEQLSKAMGNEKPSAPAPTTSAAPPPKEKTVADIADKALDMLGGTVATLASNLQKIAPYVWKVMIKQQYAKAINGIIVPLGLLLATIVFTLVMRKLWDPKSILIEKALYSSSKGDAEIAKYVFRSVVPACLIVAFSIWLFIDLGDSIKLLINPEYYAIKDILQLVTNPSAVQQ